MFKRILRYLSIWLRAPRIAPPVEVEEVDGPALPFVSPIFVLSTGRCGTKWLTGLLGSDSRMRVNHSDYPELIRHSRLAYEHYDEQPLLFQEVLRAARDGYILDAYQRHLTYVETNNRITFFAPAIKVVYPNARFVHLVRHPGDFVRSGVRRGWYNGGRHDIGRIRMEDEPTVWRSMSDIAKIAWLWNETNQYIGTFLEQLTTDDYYQARAEEMFNDVNIACQICDFIGADVDKSTIAALQRKKINQQHFGSKAEYARWSNDERSQVIQYAQLAERYGYQL